MRNCSIIMPIFNAYEATKTAIESVIKYTDLTENKLILINDSSTDSRISMLLKSYSSYAIILENEENLGFVGTVNRGMKYADNDVLLLNSDTEVTKDWLDKMKKCAYSGEMIATVTPLSNNATLFSVPIPFFRNELPDGYTLEEMADLVDKCSFCDYPEIPTGHGFCLYIKREALDKVGYFDEDAFGKGYGEENDFCYRCFNFGYRHLLCDNVYIYHKESQSFSDSKIALIEDGLKVLSSRYPKYVDRLTNFITINPIKYIADNIAFEIGRKGARPNLLYIIHDYKDAENHFGGTTLHVYDLIKNMREKYNFHVLSLEGDNYKLYSYYKQTETSITLSNVINFSDLNFYNNSYKKMLEEIIKLYHINLIHIHHMKNHFFDVIDVAKENNIYTMITLHDYYCVCPLINKIYKNVKYCDLPTTKMCNECLSCIMKNSIDIDSWHYSFHCLLENVDEIIVPSLACKEEIEKTYDDLIFNVIEHGIDIKKENSALTINDSKYLDIAFIGSIGLHKGSNILKELKKSKKLQNIHVHLFGRIDDPEDKNMKNYTNHGTYKRDELNTLVEKNNIKVICLFSTWPETYSYTMTESIACGIPVLSFDVGAIAERINKYNLGWTLPINSTVDDIIAKLQEISKNSNDYQEKIEAIDKYKIKSTKEMANDYIKIYDKNMSGEYLLDDSIKVLIKNSVYHLDQTVTNDYSWVFDTLKWKIISKIKLPNGVKSIIRKVKERK